MTMVPTLACALFALGAMSCATTLAPPAGGVAQTTCTGADLDGTLWLQSAVEAEGLARQAYTVAERMLEAALAEARWTAALEQVGDASHLPPAVILDVDETVLDNSYFEARALQRGEGFEAARWKEWVARAEAPALPGAVEFCRAAARRGVAVIFVTNREADEEEATRENLRRAGFPLETVADAVLTKGERPEWSADKGSRRAFVAASHRILLLIGDDLGDFVSGARAGLPQRQELAQAHRERWGRSWIVLPNPVYGSWERAITDGATGEAACRRKLAALRGWRDENAAK